MLDELAIRRAERALTSVYSRASDDAREYGTRWYGEAYDFAAQLASEYPEATVEQVAGAIAALSPRVHWSQNQADAETLLDWYYTSARDDNPYVPLWHVQRTMGAFPRQIDKAVDCLGADDPLTILNGPKERAFYRNIIGDADAVTVDVWMARVATRGAIDVASPTLYRTIERAIVRAARKHHTTPRDFQAAVWIAARDERQAA
jgi:hypothetical protein